MAFKLRRVNANLIIESQLHSMHVTYLSLFFLKAHLFFSPNGDYIISVGGIDFVDQGEAILWDINGKKLQDIQGHKYPIMSAAFSPDGEKIITGDWDGAILRNISNEIIKSKYSLS